MGEQPKPMFFESINTTIIVILGVIIFFGLSYSERFNLVNKDSIKKKFKEDDIIVTSASTRLEGRLNSVGFTEMIDDQNSKIKVKIMPNNGQEKAIVITPDGKFESEIYTMRDYEIDLGIVPKNYGEYPKIICTTIGRLSTGGVIIEVTQSLGADTYANKIYIKGESLIDAGFYKKTGIRDEVAYIDNAVFIPNILNSGDDDVVRVYDDSTGDIIYKLSGEDVERNNLDPNYLMCQGVGLDFLAVSSKYHDRCEEYFFDFNDETKTVYSVWDYVDPLKLDVEKLLINEKNTRGSSVTFETQDNGHNLIYNVNSIINREVESKIVIPIIQN